MSEHAFTISRDIALPTGVVLTMLYCERCGRGQFPGVLPCDEPLPPEAVEVIVNRKAKLAQGMADVGSRKLGFEGRVRR